MRRLIPGILILFISVMALQGATIWRDRNIYSTASQVGAGDFIIIKIEDLSKLKYQVDTKDTTDNSVDSAPDVTVTGFLPSVSSNKSTSYKGGITFNSRGTLSMNMAAEVTERSDAGILTLRGTRTYSMSGVTTTVLVTGRADPRLLQGRSIDSSQVADFRITVQSARPGVNLPDRQLEEEETASAELSEQQKQDLIIQYLETILSEMAR